MQQTEPQIDPRALMDLLPQKERGTLAQRFYDAVRRGIGEPEAVVTDVHAQLRERLAAAVRWRHQYPHESSFAAVRQCDTWITLLREHPAETRAFAEYVLAREQLPRAEREAEKRGRAVVYQQQAMAAQPPTVKQLAYLRALGWQDGAASKAEASALIDRLRNGHE